MSTMRIRLFGKFQVELEDRALNDLDSFKVQELLCYLLLNRDHPHHRETLAGLLWGDNQTPQSKKYLRQALWQLQLALNAGSQKQPTGLLVVDADWVSVVPQVDVWLDVQVFDAAIARARGIPGHALEGVHVQSLEEAAGLYRGDLLEGCYQEWCLLDRERLQSAYIDTLDKLMAHCEAQRQYEAGLEYGAKILRYDRARERTHWQLMRLYYSAGDRAGALRQFQRCAVALDQELDVKPSQRTIALYEQIREDNVADLRFPDNVDSGYPAESSSLLGMRERLRTMRASLSNLQDQVSREIEALDNILRNTH